MQIEELEHSLRKPKRTAPFTVDKGSSLAGRQVGPEASTKVNLYVVRVNNLAWHCRRVGRKGERGRGEGGGSE